MPAAHQPSSGTSASRLRFAALGSAVVAGLAILLFGSLVALTFRGYGRALDVRETIDRKYGVVDAYHLPADGVVSPDRMERFLAIRRVLMPRCDEVVEITRAFRRVDEVAAQHEPDVGELLGRLGHAIRQLPSMGLVFGAYVSDRNDALLGREMGLGEYTWIYAIAYFAFLEYLPARVLEERDRPRVFEDRVFPQLARVVERHIAARSMTDGPWVEELGRLRADPGRMPFRGTLPPEIAASLEPHREALVASACPAAAELDVTVTVRRGTIGYNHR